MTPKPKTLKPPKTTKSDRVVMAAKRRGRPSIKNQDVIDEIIERLSDGQTLRSICRLEHMPEWRTVYAWKENDPEFYTRFAHARDMGFDAIAEETLHIADSPVSGERVETTENGRKVVVEDMLGHRKLQIETRLKLLAKWSPKKYGDATSIKHSGDPESPIKHEHDVTIQSIEALRGRLEALVGKK